MISYAQAREDVLLHRALHHVHHSEGFYIDVGAYDPVQDSVTKHFYDHGWRGINIEPSASLFSAFLSARPRDINLQVAVSDDSGEVIFHAVEGQLGTLVKEIAEKHAQAGLKGSSYSVPARTLTNICEEHVAGEIHFLKIDVEGHEGAVLRGMDFKRYHPWILVIEATEPNRLDVPTYQEWDALVLAAGYTFVFTDVLNRYYVANEHMELAPKLSFPVDDYQRYSDVCRIAALESAMATQQADALQTITELREDLYKPKGWLSQRLYKDWFNEVEFLDGHLRNVTGIIHVGANTGQEREFYRGFGIDVIWVEPIDEVYDILLKNLEGFDRQRAYKALLADQDDKEYNFNIANNGGASSSIQEMDAIPDIWPDIKYIESRKLKSTTLESFMRRENISPDRYQALTMDVEGAELLVLRGAGSMLRRCKYVKAEVADFTPRVGSPRTSDLDAFLRDAGFEQLIRRPFGQYKGEKFWDLVWKKKPRIPILNRPNVRLPVTATDVSGIGWDKVRENRHRHGNQIREREAVGNPHELGGSQSH